MIADMPPVISSLHSEGNYINTDNNSGIVISDRCNGDVETVTVVDKKGEIHRYRNYGSCGGAVERLVNTLL